MQNYAKLCKNTFYRVFYIHTYILYIHSICVMKHTYGFFMTIVPIPRKLHKYYIMCANAYDSSLVIIPYNILIYYVLKNV